MNSVKTKPQLKFFTQIYDVRCLLDDVNRTRYMEDPRRFHMLVDRICDSVDLIANTVDKSRIL